MHELFYPAFPWLYVVEKLSAKVCSVARACSTYAYGLSCHLYNCYSRKRESMSLGKREAAYVCLGEETDNVQRVKERKTRPDLIVPTSEYIHERASVYLARTRARLLPSSFSCCSIYRNTKQLDRAFVNTFVRSFSGATGPGARGIVTANSN